MNSVKLQDKKIEHAKTNALLYTNNKLSEKNPVPFTIPSKRIIKYLRINLMKETKVCTLKTVTYRGKETEEETNRKIYHVHGLEDYY